MWLCVAECCNVYLKQCLWRPCWANDKLESCVAVCCSVLQCVAECGRVLQCVAVCCSVLTYSLKKLPVMTELWCSVLQTVADCCSVLQCVTVCCRVLWCLCFADDDGIRLVHLPYSIIGNLNSTELMMQRVAECCRVLQFVAVCCSVFLVSPLCR